MVGRIRVSKNQYPGPGKPDLIYTSELLENLRGPATLCTGCKKHKPREPHLNCKFSQELIQLGHRSTIAVLVSRCGYFDPKEPLNKPRKPYEEAQI